MTKKITLIICYCLIGIIAAALIICAIVPKDYLPRMEDPDRLTVEYVGDSTKLAFYDTTSSSFTGQTEEDYNRIVTSFRNSFKQSVLSALFAGELIVSQIATGIGEGSITTPESGFKITFEYNEYQNVYVNGQIYNNPNYSTRPVQTNIMYCYITTGVGFSGIYLYFEDDTQADVEYYRVTTLASTSALHELCMDILNVEVEEESSEATA